MRVRNIERAISAVKNAQKKIDKMNKKYPQKYKDELEEIGNRVASQWYASYNDRIFYRPKESLFDAFKVTLYGLDYSVDFSYEYMETHRKYDEYIFNNSFIEGYHGGADKGLGHPHIGVPYWRTPYPSLTFWGRPALRSFSPYNRMMVLMKKRIKEIDKEKQNEFDKAIKPVRNSILRLLK